MTAVDATPAPPLPIPAPPLDTSAPGLLGTDVVHPGWSSALEAASASLAAVEAALAAERDVGAHVLPAREHRLRALAVDPADVRVLVVGQDPYPTPGHAVGWSFSAPPGLRPLPASLRNVLRELRDDVGVSAHDGDLSPWVGRGVMMLNRVLTVRAGEAASHRRLGWQALTDAVVDVLVARDAPLVTVLWGRDAQALAPRLAGTAVVTGVHPSPLSAARGFFGSRPFSAVDAALAAQGAPPLDWSL